MLFFSYSLNVSVTTQSGMKYLVGPTKLSYRFLLLQVARILSPKGKILCHFAELVKNYWGQITQPKKSCCTSHFLPLITLLGNLI